MIRYCVICGKPFKAPPSDKKVTCSPACRSIRAANAARTSKRSWSPEARQRRRDDPAVKAHMGEIQSAGAEAALSLPEGQRGPQNRGSKTWLLIDPTGRTVRVRNLRDWARENYTLFESSDSDPEKAAHRISTGFNAIASTMRRAPNRVKSPVSSYKGWGLLELPSDDDFND